MNFALSPSEAVGLPFPASLLKSDPKKVEAILGAMPVAEQVRCVMQLQGREKQDLLLLSPQSVEVTRALPPEEVYYMVKEIGEGDCLPVLSALSLEQLQYIFDLEWWMGDKFMPDRALDWLALLEKCEEPQVFHWLQYGEFDEKVVALKFLVTIFKGDEMTQAPAEWEGRPNFSPDGVYTVFVKYPDTIPVLEKLLTQFHREDPVEFFYVMEAVIWCVDSPTVEKAYQQRLSRTAERGIPGFEEAYEIYSRLDADALKVEVAAPELFSGEGVYEVAPNYLLAQAQPSSFFSLCLALMRNERRSESIRWELVYLSNKVMVADKRDPSNRDVHKDVMLKVLNFINIGLELGSGEDTAKGTRLLEQSWMQPLFQVGYGRLLKLKHEAEKLFKESGSFLNALLDKGERDGASALIVYSVPMLRVDLDKERFHPRHFESLQEICNVEKYLRRMKFHIRFAKQCLNLTEAALEKIRSQSDIPERKEDISLIELTSTAFARNALFHEATCAPLPHAAGKAFLEMVFLNRVFNDAPRRCNDAIVEDFLRKIFATPMAWTDEDREYVRDLIALCARNIEEQFGGIDLKKSIEWKFTSGLCIRLA